VHAISATLSPSRARAEEKIARVSGADLDLFEHSLTLEIRGSEDERARAKKYVECVMAQRVGPVHIEDDDGDDLTTIMVPSEAVGFVTGSQARRPRSSCLPAPSLLVAPRLPPPLSRRLSAAPLPPSPLAARPALSCLRPPSSWQGNFLRQVEEEWGTLMFFADFRGGRDGSKQV